MKLDLDSLEWRNLACAYGNGERMPQQLRLLAEGDADALTELYALTCHQMTCYSSTIAAFPHLISIAAETADSTARADIIALAGAIMESRWLDQELAASAHAPAFHAAIPEGSRLALALLPEMGDHALGINVLQSAASFNGYVDIARVLEGIVAEEFTCNCPACDIDLYIWPAATGLTISGQDPMSFKTAARHPVQAGPDERSPHHNAYLWLSNVLAGAPNLALAASSLPYIFGTASCPACCLSIPLIDTLVAEKIWN